MGRILFALLLTTFLFPAYAANGDPTMQETTIIPIPKEWTKEEGAFVPTRNTRIILHGGTETPERIAAQDLKADLKQFLGIDVLVTFSGDEKYLREKDQIMLRVSGEEPDGPLDAESYTINIDEDGIEVVGKTPTGVFNGIQTLRQMVRKTRGETAFPHGTISDRPDFQYRGFYHDVTRGKVPKLETLKEIVDYLARYKANQFQLYIEHTYMFEFNPDIAQNPDGLTATEILELQDYCQDRRIDFVPSLQSFGHMAGVLSLPEYRHLADVELEGNWVELTWDERMKGATIDMSSAEARELLEKMHADYADLFESQFVNVCADETYDLGRGKTVELAEQRGKGRLYLDHMEWLNELVKERGKRMMFWGDIVKKHEDLIPEIPKDTILLNWGYWAKTDFESSKLFADAGLDFFVCPGTSGWNRIINGINNATINIIKYAEAGEKYGAMGLLNTDWGDHGHLNPLGGSLHGIALGCAVAWNVGDVDADEFDHAWNLTEFAGQDVAGTHRKLSSATEFKETWIKLYSPIDGERRYSPLDRETGEKLVAAGEEAADFFFSLQTDNDFLAQAAREYEWAARAHVLLGNKTILIDRVNAASGPDTELGSDLIAWVEESRELFREYNEIWLARNKYSELDDIHRAMDRLHTQMLATAKDLKGE